MRSVTQPEYKKPELLHDQVLEISAAARAVEHYYLYVALQPLRRGLDGGGPGELGPGRAG